MEIPDYIDKLLTKRADLAAELMAVDGEITEFIINNHIDVSTDHYCSGAQMYIEPYASADAVREAIRTHRH